MFRYAASETDWPLACRLHLRPPPPRLQVPRLPRPRPWPCLPCPPTPTSTLTRSRSLTQWTRSCFSTDCALYAPLRRTLSRTWCDWTTTPHWRRMRDWRTSSKLCTMLLWPSKVHQLFELLSKLNLYYCFHFQIPLIICGLVTLSYNTISSNVW